MNDDSLNKHLDFCNEVGRIRVHADDYLEFDKCHYKNRGTLIIVADFECKIIDSIHRPVACGLYIKRDYQCLLDDN